MKAQIETLNFIIYNPKTKIAEAFQTPFEPNIFKELQKKEEVTIVNDLRFPNERTIFITQYKIPTLSIIFNKQWEKEIT